MEQSVGSRVDFLLDSARGGITATFVRSTLLIPCSEDVMFYGPVEVISVGPFNEERSWRVWADITRIGCEFADVINEYGRVLEPTQVRLNSS